MNLASFAELAVRLVNSAVGDVEADPLRSCAAFREFVADRPHLGTAVTQHDLDRLRLLRTDLAAIFTRAVGGAEQAAVDRLNALMMIHPVHPVLAAHDGEPWHVHLDESGSVTDRYAAAAVISLAMLVSQLGIERFGICAIASCDRVFIDGSSNKSRRYCKEHSAARGNVMSIRAGKPYTGRSNTGRPNTGRPNTGQPNTGQPNARQPNTRGTKDESVASAAS